MKEGYIRTLTQNRTNSSDSLEYFKLFKNFKHQLQGTQTNKEVMKNEEFNLI